MRWVKDTSGRFKQRPHYSPEELDFECEKIVKTFLQNKYGQIEFPLKTDDITVLIEEHTLDFDSFADLTDEGDDVEGVTYFEKGKKPIIRISEKLQESYLENRLRTTLTHEFFHAYFHNFLYQIEKEPSLFDFDIQEPNTENAHKCKRDNILKASEKDWMEWQAGYGCGALLMPITELNLAVANFRHKENANLIQISDGTTLGNKLVSITATRFQTSIEAAKVRLLQKRHLIAGSNQKTIDSLI
jgi:hypothetical protein